MLYHVIVGITGLMHMLDENKTRDEVLTQFLCPFINHEVTLFEDKIFNMSSFGNIKIFQTTRPVDSNWPVKKGKSEAVTDTYRYQQAVEEALRAEATDVTQELYREAITLIESGQYRELRTKITEVIKGSYSFFICPLENDEVSHNYEFVIKPAVRQFQFEIQRADEISHTGTITDAILAAINRSRFIVADLTDARPNCYYEVGYAHALGKPVIILAKEDTTPHFDISTYKWNFWTDYKDLKPKFEKELKSVLRRLGIEIKSDYS